MLWQDLQLLNDRIWILASKAETNIKIVSSSYTFEQYRMTDAGEVLDFVIVDKSYYIVADKPIGVTHFVLRTKGLMYTMYRVTPTEQFVRESVTFVAGPTVTGDNNIKFAAAVIFTDTDITSSLTYDGKTLSNATEWEEIPYSGVSFASISISTQQTHVFQQLGSGGGLGGYVFGYDKYAVFAHALTLSYRDMESGCDGPCYDTSIYDKLNNQDDTCIPTPQLECATVQLPGSYAFTKGSVSTVS
ncbi:uncharacterized protein LOC132725678 [Ruditapes philippinarum]|uniref:uncharacterized protein LOC132725678 n=1 Tax=Ruditapes philippinarum TaxID=129788 RepID=UPI00295AF07F|nr:uncharacterized protein LOC132725678 [Ruditapes philippinarum]